MVEETRQQLSCTGAFAILLSIALGNIFFCALRHFLKEFKDVALLHEEWKHNAARECRTAGLMKE
jgi:hypothetical protein